MTNSPWNALGKWQNAHLIGTASCQIVGSRCNSPLGSVLCRTLTVKTHTSASIHCVVSALLAGKRSCHVHYYVHTRHDTTHASAFLLGTRNWVPKAISPFRQSPLYNADTRCLGVLASCVMFGDHSTLGDSEPRGPPRRRDAAQDKPKTQLGCNLTRGKRCSALGLLPQRCGRFHQPALNQ